MELKQLGHFLAAAETGNFSKAAARAFVSQPALSASIGKLEAELGARLFTRNKRGVTLTAEGRRLAETARGVLAECTRMKESMRAARPRERLRIGLISTISVRLLAALIRQFRDACPDVFLDLVDGSAADIDRLMAEGRLDVAFVAARAGKPPKGQVPLFAEPFVLLIPADHHLRGRRSVSLRDLDGEPFIARMQCEHRAIVAERLRKLGIRPRVAFRTDHDDRALALVQAGFGVSIVPRHYAAEGTRKLPFSDDTMSRAVGLRWRIDAKESAVGRFVTFARAASWE
jgi:DNA-binding transcriptional LysR family regulator